MAVAPDQSSYLSGTQITLTPQPAAGWHFTGWAGDLSGAANPGLLKMDAGKAVTATFSQTQPRYIAYLPLILAGNASAFR